ncbi:MAG: DUF1800 family protein, partial [Cytophagales bacterium]|nr:DUF1800 family protein [Cytophagales bacterium]
LLNRVLTGYGSRHLLDLNNLSLQKSLDLIFTPEKKPSVPVNDYDYEITKEETEKQGYLYIEPGKEYVFAPEPGGAPGPRYNSHEAWLFRNMIQQGTSIHWRMVFFLHNLLVASGGSVKMLYQHYIMLFNSSFESYKSTIYKITIDPMMLDYLNLQNSLKNKPDENYARELQELFTVGKGPNSQYTEDDVSAMARLLVGWQFSYESKEKINGPISNTFSEGNHDPSDKQFSAFYGNRLIKGRNGQDGEKELDEAIDMIFSTNECAMYLCRRLYQFFCYPIIDDTVEKNVITPMADLLRKNNFELMVPLRTLLGSAHFFDTSFYNSMIKSPIEFMFGFYKEFDLNLFNTTTGGDIPKKFSDPLTANFYKFRNLQWEMSNIGLNFTNPPSVSGWPAYYQAPVFDLFWINSDTIAKRSNSGNAIARWGLYIGSGDVKGNIHVQIDKIKFVSSLKYPDNIDLVIDETVERIMCAPISTKTKARIKASVLEGNAASYYTQLYQSHMSKPTEETRSTLSKRLENLFGALFQMGEIHLF